MRSTNLLLILFLISNTLYLYPLNITVFGIGRLGLCVALSLEKAGHHVMGIDISQEYVNSLNTKQFSSSEPLVSQYLKESKNFHASTHIKDGIAFSDLYFICVSTTYGEDAYDFSQLENLLCSFNSYKVANKHIIINSTLFPGYIQEKAINLLHDCSNISISYNAPFIAQGNIIQGFTNPDMVLIGEANPQVGNILENIYTNMCKNNPYIARMSVESAEIAKLALNCFVTMKIAFANLIGDISDSANNADKKAILRAIGYDKRIGLNCLKPGYGFGGPCFPRDNRGLGRFAKTKNIKPLLFEATDEVNKRHTLFMAKKLIERNQDEYIFRDVSYKPNSPVKILDESQKLAVAKIVAEQGKKVIIIDCIDVINKLQNQYGDLFHYQVQ